MVTLFAMVSSFTLIPWLPMGAGTLASTFAYCIALCVCYHTHAVAVDRVKRKTKP